MPMFATFVNITNVFEIAITLFGFGRIKCLILTHINGASTYPGVRVNLPRIWGRLTQVGWYKIQDTNQFIGNLVGWIVIYIIHNTIQA